jgi:hypothetical protein
VYSVVSADNIELGRLARLYIYINLKILITHSHIVGLDFVLIGSGPRILPRGICLIKNRKNNNNNNNNNYYYYYYYYYASLKLEQNPSRNFLFTVSSSNMLPMFCFSVTDCFVL